MKRPPFKSRNAAALILNGTYSEIPKLPFSSPYYSHDLIDIIDQMMDKVLLVFLINLINYYNKFF
jgi:hypothetical protein